ncbi:MAG: twin-arginine translocase TatA/TatE family subunit [Myxococcota bacterium]
MFNFANMGGWEWGIVLVLVLIFFGAGKLPQVFKQFGKATKAFKDGQTGADEELDVTPRALASDVPDAQEISAKAKESA